MGRNFWQTGFVYKYQAFGKTDPHIVYIIGTDKNRNMTFNDFRIYNKGYTKQILWNFSLATKTSQK